VSKIRTKLLTTAAALTVVACGGDDGPVGMNSGDQLTEAELQVVFYAITNAFGYLNAAPAAVGPAPATQSQNVSFDETAPCESGGSIVVNGSASATYDDVSGQVDATYHLRMTPNGCVVPTESGSITIEADPYLQLDMDFSLSDTAIEISGSEDGGIAFTSTDARSGSCLFDVDFSGNVDLENQSGNSAASGTVCGVSVSSLEVFDAGAY